MIGERLRSIRRRTGKNMKDFAGAMGVKYSTYAGYENNAHEPGIDFLTRFARQWGTTVDYLVGMTEDPLAPDPHAQVIGFTGDPARDFLTPGEYNHLLAYRQADDRAREDALTMLLSHST